LKYYEMGFEYLHGDVNMRLFMMMISLFRRILKLTYDYRH